MAIDGMPAETMSADDFPPAVGAEPAPLATRGGAGSALTLIMGRIAAGEQRALAELYDRTAVKLLGLALLIVRDEQDAQEVVCDVYLQVWQSSLRYDAARGSVLAWLLGICRARAIDRYRRKRARTPRAGAGGEPDSGSTVEDGEPGDLLQKLQEGSAIRLALEGLSPIRRRLLALAFFQGLSHQEISIATNLPIGTVKSHIRRALVMLRAQLAPEDGDGSPV